MPSKASHRRYVVVLKLPRSAPAVVTYGSMIVTKMTGNTWFKKPSPSLAKVKAALAALGKAQAARLMGGLGKTTARNDALEAAQRILQLLASYVQSIADSHVENGLAIIESAGMSAKRSSGSRAHVPGAKRGLVACSARVTAMVAADRATYFWQMSTDGGHTYVDLGKSSRSTFDVEHLPLGTTVLFRYKVLTSKGETAWSNPIPYFVT